MSSALGKHGQKGCTANNKRAMSAIVATGAMAAIGMIIGERPLHERSAFRPMRWAWSSMKISADDLILTLQRALDRFVRRLRRGGPPMATHRRFLIVQIDGLSHVVLEQGLASGRMPFVKGMLERDGYRMETMSVSLPTSTPAFQMATFYGVRPDIPGFHYYSRERQTDIHFPGPDTPLGSRPGRPAAGAASCEAAAPMDAASLAAPTTTSSLSRA